MYSIYQNDQGGGVTVYHDGEMHVADSQHPKFTDICRLCLEGNEADAVELFSVEAEVASIFERLSERVSVAAGKVYFDGDLIDNSLTTQVVRFLEADVPDWMPLVRFFDKVQQNPNEHSREQLFDWLSRYDFTITRTGDFVAYKGVRKSGDSYESISRGPAIVDGVAVNGNVPNAIGSTVEISRSLVHHDPSVGCSTGLHVGTYQYAKGFAQGGLLEVHVNPRDVVSVPTDCDWAKVRVCRYRVVDTIDTPYTSPVLGDDEDLFWDDDYYGDDE